MITTIGTVVISIYSLWSQREQEFRRAQQQRQWQQEDRDKLREWSEKDHKQQREDAVEDRNIARQWNTTDRKIELKRQLVLNHKQYIDSYVSDVVAIANGVHRMSRHLSNPTDAAELKSLEIKILDHIHDVRFHVEALSNTDLTRDYETFTQQLRPLVAALETCLNKGDSPDAQKTSEAALTAVHTAAILTKRLEEVVVTALDEKDYL